MDFIESLGKQISEITVYDVKSAIDKAKNMVMNYTEMESKVREATNDDAWGASSTLMQEIAAGTFNYQLFNEIMPVIYKRFTEKEARDWRQIYKALQLLEYLVKHGSERVVDDARSHLSMIKMLRNFHYIDEKGKDQGINVRNRSKELAELLSDLDRVRQERKKAKSNRNKYQGAGRSGGPSFTSASGSRYGGFGSDSMSPTGSSSYGQDAYPSSSQDTRRDSFEEYDAGDDEVRSSTTSAPPPSSSSARAPAPVRKDNPPPAKPAKEVNLFDFDGDDDFGAPHAAPAPAQAPAGAPAHARTLSFDDDFDDFQSAVPAASAPTSSQPVMSPPVQAQQPAKPAGGGANFFDMMAPTQSSSRSAPITPAASASQPQMRTSQHMPAGPNYSGVGLFSNAGNASSAASRPGMQQASSSFSGASMAGSKPTAPQPSKSSSAFDFDDLFAASGAKTTAAAGASRNQANSMANLAAQKSSSSIWGSSTGAGSNPSASGNKDLLF